MATLTVHGGKIEVIAKELVGAVVLKDNTMLILAKAEDHPAQIGVRLKSKEQTEWLIDSLQRLVKVAWPD